MGETKVGSLSFTVTAAPPPAAGPDSTADLQGGIVDPLGQLDRLARLTEQALSLLSHRTPGTTNANGAPELEEPRVSMSNEDFLLALQLQRARSQESQLRIAAEGVNLNGIKKTQQGEARLENLLEQIKKGNDAASLEKAGLFAGMTGALAQVVASIAAVIAAAFVATVTVGAGAALLAVALIGLAAASVNLASQISVAQGGPPIELGNMLVDALSKALMNSGMSEGEAQKVGKILSGLVGTVTGAVLIDPSFGAQMVTGFSELAGANAEQSAIVSAVFTVLTTIVVTVAMAMVTGGAAAASAVNGIAKTVTVAGKIAQIAAGGVSAAATITQGGYRVANAYVTRDADALEMERTQMAAVIAFIQKQMEDEQASVKKLVQEIMEGVEEVSKMLASASQTRSQVIANIGKQKI